MGYVGKLRRPKTEHDDLLSHGNSPVNGTVMDVSILLLKHAKTVRSQIKLRLQSEKIVIQKN